MRKPIFVSVGPVRILSILSVLCALPVLAQDSADLRDPSPEAFSSPKPADARPFADRVWFGGGVSLMFGTVTSIGVAPMMGYKVDRAGKLSTGVGINYYYFSDNRYHPSYESSTYGWSVFTRYRVIEPIYLHAEYNAENYELYSPFGDVTKREWVPFLWLGGGYAQSMGGRSYFTLQVLWDVIQDRRSPYGSQPFISAGVGVGF